MAGLFHLELKSGAPIYEQIVEAARRAIVVGALRPGDVFPSLRSLSAEYRINPNTVQKAFMVLKNEGLLEIQPGIGAVVSAARKIDQNRRDEILGAELESLVLRARQLSLSEKDIHAAVAWHWKNLNTRTPPPPHRKY